MYLDEKDLRLIYTTPELNVFEVLLKVFVIPVNILYCLIRADGIKTNNYQYLIHPIVIYISNHVKTVSLNIIVCFVTEFL